MRRGLAWLVVATVLLVGCASGAGTGAEAEPTLRIVFGGDVMLGRGVAPVVAADPGSVFADVRHQIRSADYAFINLESPLTSRAADPDLDNDLRADPASVAALANAGFDAASVANNHAGDGSPSGVLDTIAALDDSGIAAVGGGASRREANAALILEQDDLSIGVLAFDATSLGPAATATSPGIARWDREASLRAIADTRPRVDVLVVSVHGGAEYVRTPDATMRAIVADLAELDVDIVWGHGPHVVQPIATLDPGNDGRDTLSAPSLGNFLFDQNRPGTDSGALLEVVVGRSGVAAFRHGVTEISGGRVAFDGWELPEAAAVLIDGEWWSLPEPPVAPTGLKEPDLVGFAQGLPITAAAGDVDGDGDVEAVVSFRRPFEPSALSRLLPERQWQDAAGQSAHLGVFEPSDLSPIWVASAMLRPVSDIAACDGAIAVNYSELDAATVTGTGGWVWSGFGWDEAPDLAGKRTIGCSDIDGDGRLDPVVGPETGG